MQVIDKLSGELEMKRLGWPGIASVFARSFLTYSLVSLGEFEKARQIISRAIEQVRLSVIHIPAGTAYVGQGFYQLAIGKSKEAIKSFEVAYRISQRDNVIMLLSIAFLGAAYAQGRTTGRCTCAAVGSRAEGYVWTSSLHADSLITWPWLRLTSPWVHCHLRRRLSAAPRKLLRRAQAPGLSGRALQIRANIAAKDPAATADDICAIYQRAIDIARPCGMRPLIAQCLAGMAQAHEAAGDVAAAADYDNQARQLFDELGLPPDSPMRRQ